MFQRTQKKYKSTACARSSARQSNNNDYDWYCIPWIYGVDRFMRHIGNKSKINYVLLALSPAILMLIYQFGWSVLVNLSIAITSTLCLELIIVTLAKQKIKSLQISSSTLIGIYIAIALPPLVSWWVIIYATLIAITAKNVFGIDAKNPFNSSMVGYAATLISFPNKISTWILPRSLRNNETEFLNLHETLSLTFNNVEIPDSLTGATALEVFKYSNDGLMLEQIYQNNKIFSDASFAIVGWEWISISFLIGGLFLIIIRVITWHSPTAMIGSICFLSLLFFDNGSSSSGGSAMLHLFGGATMLGAFFIITDPSSSPETGKGKIIFGSIIGVLVYIIRVWGGYPDALAFAVILGNFATPLINKFTFQTHESKA